MFSRWSEQKQKGVNADLTSVWERWSHKHTLSQLLKEEVTSHLHTHPPLSLFVFLSFPVSVMRTQLNPSVCLCLLTVFSVWSVKPWVLVIWVIRPPAVRIKVCSDAFDTRRSVWYWYSSADADGCVTDAAQSRVFYCKTHNNTIFVPWTHTQHDARKHRWRGSDSAPDRQRHAREIHLPLTSWKLWL